jgi:hypothetical protein
MSHPFGKIIQGPGGKMLFTGHVAHGGEIYC